MLAIRLAAAAAALVWAASAFAADCASDLQNLSSRRASALQSINQMVAATKGKKLDPEVFCARSRPLNAAEEAMIAYMVKNKDWCQIPDDAISQLKDSHAKSVAFAGKACGVAAQIAKMKKQAEQAQAQQQAGGAPQVQPLPAGPL
jgi:hypothetical protein